MFCARWLLPLFIGASALIHLDSGHISALIFMINSVIFASLVSVSVSLLVRRKRPYEKIGDLRHLQPFLYTPSFPSDHATVAFAIAGSFVISYDLILVIPVFLVAGAIALSRVLGGVHYLSDVFVGALIGLVTNWFIGTFFFL